MFKGLLAREVIFLFSDQFCLWLSLSFVQPIICSFIQPHDGYLLWQLCILISWTCLLFLLSISPPKIQHQVTVTFMLLYFSDQGPAPERELRLSSPTLHSSSHHGLKFYSLIEVSFSWFAFQLGKPQLQLLFLLLSPFSHPLPLGALIKDIFPRDTFVIFTFLHCLDTR